MAIQKVLIINSDNDVSEYTPLETSSGASDGGKFATLKQTTGRFDMSVMPAEFEQTVVTLPFSEGVSAGDFLNIWDDSGTVKFRKADGSSISKKAEYFALEAKTAGQSGAGYKKGVNNQLSNLTKGAIYVLSDTVPGGVLLKSSAPTTTGHILQILGKATSATEMLVEIQENPIIRA